MKQTLTLEDIDDYVQALTAFLPTPAQRKLIQEYQYAIEKNPQYQVLIQRKLAIANIPTTFLQNQTISIQEIIENTLQELKVKVQGQIEKTFSVSTYRMSFVRGEDVDMNQIFAPVTMERMQNKIARDNLKMLQERMEKREEEAKKKNSSCPRGFQKGACPLLGK